MTILEIWKPAFNFPNYEVSNLGRIRRLKNGRVIKLAVDANGYYVARIHYNKKKYTKYVHRLVWNSFNLCNCALTIDHIDENKKNNYLGNLRCVELKEQYVDRNFVPKTNKYNLTDEIKRTLQTKFEAGASIRSLAVSQGLPYNYVRETMKRGSWKKYLKNELETD